MIGIARPETALPVPDTAIDDRYHRRLAVLEILGSAQVSVAIMPLFFDLLRSTDQLG
jgi:hypothetical protein